MYINDMQCLPDKLHLQYHILYHLNITQISYLYDAMPPSRTAPAILYSLSSEYLFECLKMIQSMKKNHLSDSSDVLQDHVVSSLETVELNIRLDCCKEPELHGHIAEKVFVFAFVFTSVFGSGIVCETLRHSVDDNLSTIQRTADLGHIVPKLLI